ncbi:MAG: T9SS type A sorting domain-containing protein [Flavobacteriales bacterium]|nr:T9SS type A sorting domain-containing protein [Flavobacteriales bacterium]
MQIRIVDNSGRLCHSEAILPGTMGVGIPSLSAGIYHAQFTTEGRTPVAVHFAVEEN